MLGKICKKHETLGSSIIRCEACLDDFNKREYERGKRDGKIEAFNLSKNLLEEKAWMPGEATLFNKLHFELCEELEKLKGEK